MLDLYPFILETLTALRPAIDRVGRADSDLGRQLRRSLMSIPLNVAEGFYSSGRNRRLRYFTALGSTREALACFEVASALGLTPALGPAELDRFDRILRTLLKLTR